MPISDTTVRNAKPREKSYRLADARGMYLEVTPAGGKYWRMKYRVSGKEKRLALGVYPDVSLAQARERCGQARKLLADGVDPGVLKQTNKAATENSFEAVAREWHAKFSPGWATSHADKIIRRLEGEVFPWLGSRPIGDVNAPELLKVLRRIEARGALETAHRVHQNCGKVFRYAVATGRAQRDPSSDLRGAIPPAQEHHHPTITEPKRVGELLRAIAGYSGSYITRGALQLAPLVFVRPGELRKAEWSEFDLDKAEWRIPEHKMKMKAVHIVPLSTQAVLILRDLHALTGTGRYVFPGARGDDRHMSENTVNAGLRRLGYAVGDMTGHGFRSMASTLLNEQGWNRDAIERQLAHAERDEIRAAYNYAEHLSVRRKMMQAWANYLDKLKAVAEDIPILQSA
ncbi:MAG: tyrosine-type recombinase/integrase [Gammaproteobacteria bacterium]|nr:tyrosine-type recombinase/integrase [Gammaproteobacteria bacterium]